MLICISLSTLLFQLIDFILSCLLLLDSMEKPTYIRFLVSNAAAGSVIGKGGSTITDFQSQSGARIQLSRNQEFFPGTTDRIIMVSGTINETLKAVELILLKLLSEVILMFVSVHVSTKLFHIYLIPVRIFFCLVASC